MNVYFLPSYRVAKSTEAIYREVKHAPTSVDLGDFKLVVQARDPDSAKRIAIRFCQRMGFTPLV